MILGDDNMENAKPFPKPNLCSKLCLFQTLAPKLRMYCRLRQHEFSVAGAFTIDYQFK